MATVLEEKDAIRDLLSRYCFLVDGARFDEWAELFTEDGVFEVPGVPVLEGRDAILRFIRKIPLDQKGTPGFKHCVLNERIAVSGESATAECYLLLVRDGKPVQVELAGRYEDAIVKRDGQWRFRKRKVHFDFGSLGERA